MRFDDTAAKWAEGLGLIDVPLLSQSDQEYSFHSVLLDGGQESFALSSGSNSNFDINRAANWVWSANLPHHVYVNNDYVTLSRWDDPASTRRFARHSVESRLETFYEYLFLDRIRNRLNVVEHAVNLLRRIRSVVNEEQLPDEASLHIFLFIIAILLSDQQDASLENPSNLLASYALDPAYLDSFCSVETKTITALIEQFTYPINSFRTSLELIPQLLVRHAGGTIFQEAHFEIIQSKQIDLFGLPAAADVRVATRGGIHFTPPGLARAIVEQTFAAKTLPRRITILDPACGAGAFLHEALRFLRRINYEGSITLLGYDSSPNAVAMARFALTEARKDWREGNIENLSIEVRDSLNETQPWPQADFIFMNPPFLAWENLENSQRSELKRVLGKWYAGRPDYSMGFVEKAITSISLGGTIGTLLPASILSLEASLKWRHHILDETHIRFLSVLGDHGLFRHAIVEVAAVILERVETSTLDNPLVSLWSSERRGASSEALRNLRKRLRYLEEGLDFNESVRGKEDNWRISLVAESSLAQLADWRPRPNRLLATLVEINESTATKLGDVFHVQQGVRAGLRAAFIINEQQLSSFPEPERKYFRPVAENRNIKDGKIGPHDFIFYPSTKGLKEIRTEDDLKEAVPTFYNKHLTRYRDSLIQRKSLKGKFWWSLIRPRTYFNQSKTKLVSAYFGDSGSFALDLRGDYVVVQGFAWYLRATINQKLMLIGQRVGVNYVEIILYAYLALLNSDLFSFLLAEFCPHVAGGQFNLSKKFIEHIPFPDLTSSEMLDPDLVRDISGLAKQGQAMTSGHRTSPSEINELVARTYRVPLSLWPTKTNR